MKFYIPEPLNPIVIDEIFKTSLPTRGSTNIIKCILFKKENGFPEDSRAIFFDADVLTDQKDSLEYLLGQLKAIHDKKKEMTPQDAIYSYDGTVWIKDQSSLLQLLHLACAADLLSPINSKTSTLNILKELYPTISTFDPNFFEWEKEHKPKILKLIQKENGQEPADD